MKLSPTQIKEIAERSLDAQCQALLKEWAKDGTLVKWMAERIAAQDEEIGKLRAILSKVATNIGNGSFAAPDCTLDFFESVAAEVALNAGQLRASIAKLERERDEEEDIRARDEAQDALSAAHVALGGDGEWVFRIPAPEPPESGNLLRDVPALAAEVVRERDEARARIAQLESLLAMKDGALASIEEYWNRDPNERAMQDACEHAIATAREALKGSAK